MLAIASCTVIMATCLAQTPASPATPGPEGAASSKTEVTAAQVVAAYLHAIGGTDAVRAVNSRRITYRVHMFGREPYLMERSWARPGTMRTGPPGADSFTLTEGEKSWRIGPGGRRELPPAVAASMSKMADIDGPFVDSSKKGITLTYFGLVRYDMAEFHRIVVTFRDGVEWTYFFDSVTGLLRRSTRPTFVLLNGETSRGPDADFYYYDYRPVGSVLYPHYWIQASEDHTHLFVVEDITLAE